MANTAAQEALRRSGPTRTSPSCGVDWLADLYRRTSRTAAPVEPRGYESAIQVLDEGGGERFFLPHAVPDPRRASGNCSA